MKTTNGPFRNLVTKLKKIRKETLPADQVERVNSILEKQNDEKGPQKISEKRKIAKSGDDVGVAELQ